METLFNNSSVCSPPVKYNSFTCGGGIFGFAKNNLEKEESVQEETNTSAATAPTNSTYWDASASRVDTTWIGNGTQASPWLITSAAELAGLSYTIYNNTKADYLTSTSYYYSGCYFKQTVDIDVSAYYWQPIGLQYNRSGTTINRYFSGNYDGDGYTVSGIFTKTGTTNAYSNQGLFGYCYNATISKLAIKDSIIKGYMYVGGIVGFSRNISISACYSAATVTASSNYAGGIIGNNYGGVIKNCYNSGTITGLGYVGGIAGVSTYTAGISCCYNLGTVSGGSGGYTGGITGYNFYYSSYIKQSFNLGSVSSSGSYVGGVVGRSADATETQCFYGGNCTLSVGIGESDIGTTITRNSQLSAYVQVKSNFTSSGNFSLWDFNTVWEIKSGVNNTYPIFQWQATYTLVFYNNMSPTASKSLEVVGTRTFTTPESNCFERTGYTISSWNTKADGTGTTYYCGNQYTYSSSTLGTVFYAQWTAYRYTLDVNGNLDGTASGDLGNYAKFDMYINGSRVATQVNDYSGSVAYGSTYEVKNITYATDKAYVGVYSDNACTTASSLSGTMPASSRIVCLKIRTMTWNDYAANSYASGSGTASSPYIIKTPEQLAKVAVDSRSSTLSGKYYKMVADVDLSAHIWEGIGDTSQKFAGCFDGDLYQIKNIITTIDNYQVSNVIGLFSFVQSPSVIKNIIMKGGTVTAGASASNCGIIAGATESAATITNCIVDGITVQGNDVNSSMGGIAGKFTSGKISNCIVMNCNIISKGTVGGICGWRGTLTDCAVINTTVASGWNISSREVSIGWSDNSTVNSSYAKVTIAGAEKKIMYGDSTAWANWTYNSMLNGGYPVQTTLFHIGGLSGSTNVYNYLKNTLGFTVA